MYSGNQASYENLSENMKQKLEELKIPIVNDLITGGSDKALSAESGKELKNLVDEKADGEDLKSLQTEVTEHLAQIEQMKPKVDNSWQLNQYNHTTVSNLGHYTAEKVLMVNNTNWKDTGNVEQLDIIMPVGGSFSGLIKVTFTSFWGGSDSHGGATVLYRVGNYTSEWTGTRLNDYIIETITPDFARDFYIHKPYMNTEEGNGAITLLLSKAPTANNPLVIKIEFQGYNFGQKNAFQVMKETNFAIYDKGSPTHNGYPWTPQKSNWDKRETSNIANGRDFSINGVPTNLATFTPAQFRDFLSAYLPIKMGTFKCFVNAPDIGVTTINGYGVLTTIKPWLDESGGGLTQIFEAADVIQKRFQVDDNTWSPWITIQHKDVDIKQLFQSVSEGKADNRATLAQRGVNIPVNPTFAQISQGIRDIPTGKAISEGSVNVPAFSGGNTVQVDVTFTGGSIRTAMLECGGGLYIHGLYYGNTKISSGPYVSNIQLLGNTVRFTCAMGGGLGSWVGGTMRYTLTA